MDQHMYKIGRRFNQNKYQAQFSDWHETRVSAREELQERNKEAFNSMRIHHKKKEVSYSVKEFVSDIRSQEPNKSLTGYDLELTEYLLEHF